MWFEKLIQLLRMGGVPLGLMLVASVITVVVCCERIWYLWSFLSRSKALLQHLQQLLSKGQWAFAQEACRSSTHPVARIFGVGVEQAARTSFEKWVAAMDRQRQRAVISLKRPLWILGTIGATTPFIGLFGTVVGIMGAFQALSSSKKAGFEVVGPGISEALVSTAVGIGVAIVALVAFNFLQTKIARVSTEVKLMTEELVDIIQAAIEPTESPAKNVGNGG